MTYMPPPHPKAMATAMERLRESTAFREEVWTTGAQFLPASFLEDDSTVSVSYIPVLDLREVLRVIEAQEAARSVAEEYLRPSPAKVLQGEEPGFIRDEVEFLGPPTTACVRTR